MGLFRVAVDAMGGDNAPDVVIKGVADYLRDNSDTSVQLVGKERILRREIKKNNLPMSRVEIVNAVEEINMREHFFSYWKKREKTSVKKAIDLVGQGKADAVVSSGNTGAIMALAKTSLGTLPNIDRPVLSLMIPTLKGETLMMDVGANVDPKPLNLAQSALMGKVYLENVVGKKNPSVALMSIGEEDVKGNELTKSTFNILKSMDINFIGNIEGRDAYLGDVDMIVTDGFTGNITLKVAEGVVGIMYSMLKREINSSILGKVGFYLLKNSVKRIYKKLDYTERGGALLLGVNGIVVVGHGNSNPKAVKNAIALSTKFIKERILHKLSDEIDGFQENFKEYKYV